MTVLTAGARFAVNMDALGFAPMSNVTFEATNLIYADIGGGNRDTFYGNFSYDGFSDLAGGVLNHVQETLAGFLHFDISGFSVSAVNFADLAQSGSTISALTLILGGADQITGSPLNDNLFGLDGNDTINGGGGYDTVFGGAGDDVIIGGTGVGPGEGYLRGEDGNDSIVGGINFDDINGNAGSDTIHGGAGDDWVVGGKDNDLLFGDDGADIVYGNLGDDTLDGGAGNDLIRGGQGDDSLAGGAGNDWISGDRGNDTMSGGPGADTFHSFGGAGIDRVLDFSAAEGDRVQLDLGTTYTVTQVGADTVIDMVGGGQMTLVGVNMATLPSGWIFEA